jgi:hypothetical protein
MAKLRNEADVSLRGDLLKRIGTLEIQQIEDRKLHAEQRESDRRDCQKETDSLRQRIREQDKLIDGLQRQLIMFQVATGRALPMGTISPEIEKMISTLSPLFESEEEKSDALRAAEETHSHAEETKHAARVAVEQIKQDELSPKGGASDSSNPKNH